MFSDPSEPLSNGTATSQGDTTTAAGTAGTVLIPAATASLSTPDPDYGMRDAVQTLV